MSMNSQGCRWCGKAFGNHQGETHGFELAYDSPLKPSTNDAPTRTVLPEAIYKYLVRGHTLRVLTPTAALGKYAADMTTVIEGEKIQGNHELTPEAAIDALAKQLEEGGK